MQRYQQSVSIFGTRESDREHQYSLQNNGELRHVRTVARNCLSKGCYRSVKASITRLFDGMRSALLLLMGDHLSSLDSMRTSCMALEALRQYAGKPHFQSQALELFAMHGRPLSLTASQPCNTFSLEELPKRCSLTLTEQYDQKTRPSTIAQICLIPRATFDTTSAVVSESDRAP